MRNIERYQKLIELIDEKFIPRILKSGYHYNEKTNENERIYHVDLKDLEAIGLRREERSFLFDYVDQKGIIIFDEKQNVVKHYDRRNYKYRNYPSALNQDEIKEKFKLLEETHDPNIRAEIIVGNMRFVKWIATTYARHYGIDMYEVEQYGYEGLINAVDRYKLDLGYSFSSYAFDYIKWSIVSGVIEQYGLKRGAWTDCFFQAKMDVEMKSGQTLLENPNLIHDIYQTMVDKGHIRETNLNNSLNRINLLISAASLENFLIENDIIDNDFKTKFEKIALKKDIMDIINTFDDRTQEIIKLRFGFIDGKEWTLEEIGNKLNLTRERVRQIIDKSLKRMKHPINYRKLKDYKDIDLLNEDYLDVSHSSKK